MSDARPPPPASSPPGDLVLLTILGAALVLALGALVGLGVAAFLFGGGWVWPPTSSSAVHTLGGLLTGRPGRGLDVAAHQRVPGRFAVYTVVAVVEVVVIGVTVGCLRWSMAAWGGTRTAELAGERPPLRNGRPAPRYAAAGQVAAVLGRRSLSRRRVAAVRPDLYGKRKEM
jgi:hypothetical protein